MDVETLNSIFKELEKAETVEELKEIKTRVEAKIGKKFTTDEQKYPRINFEISPEEINILKETDTIINGNVVLTQSQMMTPLEKLMYAVLWKQGDLPKLKHIIDGINFSETENSNEPEIGLVFHQFGRFLADKKEPIIDQHVLRAFGIFKAEDKAKQDEFKKLELIEKKKHSDLINAYKEWLNKHEFSNDPDKMFLIDRLLMSVGRAIKRRKNDVKTA
jgi:hypothetical protein